MQLQDLKPSILQLSAEEEERLHRDVRRRRFEAPVRKKAASKTKKEKAKKVSASLRKIAKDPNQIKKLLELLGEA